MQIKTKIISSHTADSKPVKLEVNGTVILPPLVFPAQYIDTIEIVVKLYSTISMSDTKGLFTRESDFALG